MIRCPTPIIGLTRTGGCGGENKGWNPGSRRSGSYVPFDPTPIPCPQWWVPYVESPEPHLMYQFALPSHWDLHVIATDDDLISYDRSRGMHTTSTAACWWSADAPGGQVHGGEHDDFSSAYPPGRSDPLPLMPTFASAPWSASTRRSPESAPRPEPASALEDGPPTPPRYAE